MRCAHKHTHTPTPQPGVAGRSRNPSPSTHAHTAHPRQEWRSTSRARTEAYAGLCDEGMQEKSIHRPQHPSQEWRGAAETRVKAHTAKPHTPARNGGAQAERTHKHTNTPSPQQGVAGRSRNPSPRTTLTQTQASHNSRKPSAHSPSTEAACAMQVTRPNEIRRPGVRLHPKASAALGLEAERATPKRLGTPVPRTCMHAWGTGYARKSGEPLGFRPKEGTCAGTGAHPPGETSTSCWRQSALRLLPGAALLGATRQV